MTTNLRTPCSDPWRHCPALTEQPNRRVVNDGDSLGAMTMKLTATMMLTVDGVYQGPGGPDEDRRGGFERGGWTAAHADEETGRFLDSVIEGADALLLGRRPWGIFHGYWPDPP